MKSKSTLLSSLHKTQLMKNFLILEDDIDRIVAYTNRIYTLWPEESAITFVNHASLAIRYIANNNYDFILLDHDLGGRQIDYNKENCGDIVADYLHDNPTEAKVIVHSLNIPAATRMVGKIKNASHIPFLWLSDQFYKHIVGYSTSMRK